MTVFVLGLIIFFAMHLVPTLLPGLREKAIDKIGPMPWKGIYALVSLIGLVLIVRGWSQFRPDATDVYTPPEWGAYANALLSWIAFVLFSIPRSKPGRILVIVKHPMLVGTIYWSVGHLLANGDMASVLLFGSFLAFAFIDRVAQAIKGDPSHQFVSHRGDITGIIFGTILYVIFVGWVHVWLIGVSPF